MKSQVACVFVSFSAGFFFKFHRYSESEKNTAFRYSKELQQKQSRENITTRSGEMTVKGVSFSKEEFSPANFLQPL